jgi:uncharacterized protein YwqG
MADSLARALHAAGIAHAEALAALAVPSVRLTPTRAAASLPMGASRLGGSPDVPLGFEWPTRSGRALTFLTQLALADVRAPALPATGWLLFFYDAELQPWGFDPADDGCAPVIHVDVARDQLTRCPHPEVADDAGPFARCAVELTASLDLAGPEDSLLVDAGIPLTDDEANAYDAQVNGDPSPYHHLIGHPQLIQGDMRRELDDVAGGGAPWHLLLQLDSDEDGPGWMWGDLGRLYFWIRADDLAARRFDRVWLILQCS